MAKKVALVLGLGFLVVGLAGFVAPTLLGAHLSPAHNVVHLLTGAISVWFGTKGSVAGAKAFAIIFGVVYEILGLAGFALGVAATSHLGTQTHLLRVIPGVLELGTVDHVIHLVLGSVYLLAGLATRIGHVTVAPPSRPHPA